MNNYQNLKQETTRMLELAKYGLNESSPKKPSTSIEYSEKGADGRTYGIVCEGTKFYIKVAPRKNTKVLAEDYEYLNGRYNKKQAEYNSYSSASKDLNLILMQVNEKINKGKRMLSETVSRPQASWQTKTTIGMRNEINRMNQISENVSRILESEKTKKAKKGFTSAHTLPEAPGKNPSRRKVTSPFTDTAQARGDREFETRQTNRRKAGYPFVEALPKGEIKLRNGRCGGNPYTLKSKLSESGIDYRGSRRWLDEQFAEQRARRRFNEGRLNVFGKHPSWRKQPMTLPPNREVSKWGREWDDESARGEKPYGNDVVLSAPYDKVVKAISKGIMDEMRFRGKAY